MGQKKTANRKPTDIKDYRPPIVTVMGHVDHGKTTLLDAIRQSHVVDKEFGGITQHIGAYQVDVETKEGIKKITFIDTPGHEAFFEMRKRGALATDLVIIVIDAKDSVMPQTIESINHCRQAGVPFLIAVNKIDLPEANLDRVKKHLVDKAQVLVEGYGGDIVVVPISAKNKQGIDNLLEMILLLAQIHKISGNKNGELDAIIIESRMDKFKGPIATVVLKNGLLKIGEYIFTGNVKGKIKAIINDQGKIINELLPGGTAEILGFEQVPNIGEKIYFSVKSVPLAENLTEIASLEMKLPEIKTKKFNIVLKTDTFGSLEAIKKNLNDKIDIIYHSIGEISESDILRAKATKSIVIGFNVKIPGNVKKLADNERILVNSYQLIYLLFEELEEAALYIDRPLPVEKILGTGKVLAIFGEDKNLIAGVKVLQGRLAKKDSVRIERNNDIIGNARIISLKHGKENIDKADLNMECGMVFDSNLDFQIDDAIISYRKII